jgi:hypothetical protein
MNSSRFADWYPDICPADIHKGAGADVGRARLSTALSPFAIRADLHTSD